MTTKNRRKSKEKEKRAAQKTLPKNSLYFSNRKEYYKIQEEEMKLNEKYQFGITEVKTKKIRKGKSRTSAVPVPRRKKREVQREISVPKERIRKQVAINYRMNEEPYFISIRALTINPEITERGLKMEVISARNKLEGQGIRLSQLDGQFGYESRKIAPSEDRSLNDMKVHVEIYIKRSVTTYIV